MKKDVTDTSKLMGTTMGRLAIIDNLTGAVPFGDSIEAMEAAGQKELVNSEQIPVDCPLKDVAALTKAGVTFGRVEDGEDSILRRAVLPDGWKKVPTRHPMWSDLQDEKGRIRANIFYKAAFYDRKAHIRAVPRYVVDLDLLGTSGKCLARVKDKDAVLFETPVFEQEPYPDPGSPAWGTFKDCMKLANEAASAWLDANYPEWKDISAYWDS